MRLMQCLAVLAAAAHELDAQRGCPGVIRAQVGPLVESSAVEFTLTMVREPTADAAIPVNLRFDNTGDVKVSPDTLRVEPGKFSRATLKLSDNHRGLVRLKADIEGFDHCSGLDRALDAGFRQKVRLTTSLNAPSDSRFGTVLEPGNGSLSFQVLFREYGGDRDVRLPTPVILEVSSPLVEFSRDGLKWEKRIAIPAPAGASESGLVMMRTPDQPSNGGVIHVTAKMDSGEYQLSELTVPFRIRLRERDALMFTALGALLYTLYVLLTDLMKKDKPTVPRIALSVASTVVLGIVAHVAEASKMVGVDINPVSAKAFTCLGLVVACLGFDGLVRRLTKAGP